MRSRPHTTSRFSSLFATLALLLAGFGTNSGAALVTTTAEFTRFTMGGFYSGANAFANQLKINGSAIDICNGDRSCVAALLNPQQISIPIFGSKVSFGYTNPAAVVNRFSFESTPQEVLGVGADNKFVLGKVTFVNGQFYPLAFIDFVLTTHSIDPLLDNHSIAGSIRLDVNSTNPVLDPESEADYFTAQDPTGRVLSTLGSVRVYDNWACPAGTPAGVACNTGSVEVVGHINSLHLDYFANPTGGAFLNPSVGASIAPLPEPGTTQLVALSLLLLAAMRAGSGHRQELRAVN